jgi:hypothetical protein
MGVGFVGGLTAIKFGFKPIGNRESLDIVGKALAENLDDLEPFRDTQSQKLVGK